MGEHGRVARADVKSLPVGSWLKDLAATYDTACLPVEANQAVLAVRVAPGTTLATREAAAPQAYSHRHALTVRSGGRVCRSPCQPWQQQVGSACSHPLQTPSRMHQMKVPRQHIILMPRSEATR